jgi:hypothetical protein
MRGELLEMVAVTDPWPDTRPVPPEFFDLLAAHRRDESGPEDRRPVLVAGAVAVAVALLLVTVWASTRAVAPAQIAPADHPSSDMTLPTSESTAETIHPTTVADVVGSGEVSWRPAELPVDVGHAPLVAAFDRILIADRDAGSVWSHDGTGWSVAVVPEIVSYQSFAGWSDTLVGWEGGGVFSDGTGTFAVPGRVLVVRPDTDPLEYTFDGGRVASAAVNAIGIVIALDSADSLGAEGPRFRGRFSVDGDSWAEIDEFPQVEIVVGVDGGFVALGDSAVWHSADGLEWARSGDGLVGHRRFVVFGDRLLVESGAGLHIVSDVIEELRLPTGDGEAHVTPIAATGDTIVIVDVPSATSWVSSDGFDWVASPLPTVMAEANNWGMWEPDAAALGDLVLVRLLGAGLIPTWWEGTLD